MAPTTTLRTTSRRWVRRLGGAFRVAVLVAVFAAALAGLWITDQSMTEQPI